MNLRHFLFAFLVGFCLTQVVQGCGVTQWQRDQDRLWGSFEDTQSPKLAAQIAAAHPGVPRDVGSK